MNNINCLEKKKCTGCMLCVSKCPIDCINIVQDTEGFFYPNVNVEKCVNCGKCAENCPSLNRIKKNTIKCVYMAQYKDDNKLIKSASGGIGQAMAREIISQGGVVYGCIYDNEFVARHTRVDNLDGISKLNGSKYVQSDFSHIYNMLDTDIKSDKNILIIGTPCQIASAKKYINKDNENIIYVDLIRHGVPSPKLFNTYLEWLQSKIGIIKEINFRDKSKKGWGVILYAEGERKSIYKDAELDPYYSSFLRGECFRECCYDCEYSTYERVGDITIGDFWGCQKQHPNSNLNTKDGVSVVIINTSRGDNFINKLSDNLELIKSDINKAKVENFNLYKAAERPVIRNVFYKNAYKKGIKWLKIRMKNKAYISRRIKNLIPTKVKGIIKSIVR